MKRWLTFKIVSWHKIKSSENFTFNWQCLHFNFGNIDLEIRQMIPPCLCGVAFRTGKYYLRKYPRRKFRADTWNTPLLQLPGEWVGYKLIKLCCCCSTGRVAYRTTQRRACPLYIQPEITWKPSQGERYVNCHMTRFARSVGWNSQQRSTCFLTLVICQYRPRYYNTLYLEQCR